jgi:cytochrome c oxidase subunit II
MIRRALNASAALWLSILAAMLNATAWAAQPVDWQIDMQPAATAHMQDIIDFHHLLVVIITAISLFVLALLLWIMVRYNKRANPVPAKFSHNTAIEIVWTVVPIFILIFIGWFSVPLLYRGDVVPKADMTIKVTGLPSWAWTYKYPDHGDIEFTSIILSDEEAKAKGEPRLLGVTEQMVVPVGKVIRMQVTSDPGGMIHAWTVPAFGVKIDAVPGKLNETWFKVEPGEGKERVYYGQCSELCGVKHAYMPIAVKVVSQAEFDAWVAAKKAEAALNKPGQNKLASR